MLVLRLRGLILVLDWDIYVVGILNTIAFGQVVGGVRTALHGVNRPEFVYFV